MTFVLFLPLVDAAEDRCPHVNKKAEARRAIDTNSSPIGLSGRQATTPDHQKQVDMITAKLEY